VIRRVLVTDGEQRSTLAAVRSLGRAGYRVYVCSRSGRSLAGASRFALDDRSVASALSAPRQFASDVRALIDDWNIDIFLPMTEETCNAAFDNEDLFAGVCMPVATAEQFRDVSDKKKVLEIAEACGLSVPAQVVVNDAPEARQLASTLRYPLVAKPARSVAQDGEKQLKTGVVHCADATKLLESLAKFPASAYPLLLQQRVVGPGVGVFLLLWDGELVAHFGHRRLREKPPAGGVSVYRESISVDESLLDKSRRLLERIGWRGVAMIEYKIDDATGTPYIMEINGRFWGSLQLAIDAGVDFPRLLLARAEGKRVRGPDAYRVGIRSRWEWGGVDYVWARLRHSDQALSLPPGHPSRAASLLSAAVPWMPGDRLEVLRLSDPAPFLRETVQYFTRS